MAQGRLPGETATYGALRAQEDDQWKRLVDNEGQTVDDSEASGCESSGCDPSPSFTPHARQGSSLGSGFYSSSSLEKSDPLTALQRHDEPSRDVLGKWQSQQAEQPAITPAPTAAANRASAKVGAGTACLAPRRLRSKALPRVAWVSGKFIRELGSDEHRAAKLPKCASYVYSVCHVEGYDIRAVYQDALQKLVRCRLMTEDRSALMLEVDDSLHLADPKARSQEAFEATCGLHGVVSGGSQPDVADGVRSCASAVMAGDDGEDSAWGWQTPPLNTPSTEAQLGTIILQGDTSSEIDAAAAGGARSFRRGMRMLSSGRLHSDTAKATVAFIFESGPVVLWIAGSDARAKDSRGRRELLSSLLFFLSHFATRFVRADMMQEDVMRFAYVRQVRTLYPPYEIPKSRILQDCIYLKTESAAEKLAASFALSQSIRLSVYESLINFTIARVRAIPEHMARFGSAGDGTISSSNSTFWTTVCNRLRWSPARAFAGAPAVQPLVWSCLCGDLLGKIVDVNIVQDFRDVPEYFWNDDTWQHFWRRLYGHLEIQKRINLLNNRYFCIHELLKVIREERRSRQEFRLTWIVVILLFFQVLAVALRNFVIHP